ncbi:hypothetical protein WKR98_21665 [Pigmentiphaga sp. YJ18]|uniref:hypothetical protein n=1 Tax=Pigmentiphaga sp. YJ18 TaxID=3134907 RepID=UPI00311463B3
MLRLRCWGIENGDSYVPSAGLQDDPIRIDVPRDREGSNGLKGMPEALAAVFPATTLKTCIVYLTRNSPPSTPVVGNGRTQLWNYGKDSDGQNGLKDWSG